MGTRTLAVKAGTRAGSAEPMAGRPHARGQGAREAKLDKLMGREGKW